MAYDNDDTGMLARNERKEKPSHPDFRGTIRVAGVDYWLSAWIKEGKAGGKMEGKKFFSLSVEPKQPRADQPRTRAESPAVDDDDIPF